jgi:outer membrane protein assembly factor BamB
MMKFQVSTARSHWTYTVLVAVFLLAAAGVRAENWPQWRGPGGQGISRETKVPEAWTPAKNVAWKVEVPGRGHSAPVVWNDRVFLTTAIEGETVPGAKAVEHVDSGKPFLHPDSVGADKKHTYKVLAYDGKTGKLVWEQTAWSGVPFDNRHRRSSYASASVATNGAVVIAYFGAEGVYAYDSNGKPAWNTSVGKVKTLGLGAASSPVIHQDLVILQCDDDGGSDSAIVALDVKSGKERWRTKRPVQVSWSTPVLVNAAARTELVTNGTEWVIAYDPATGKELWRTKGVESNAIHTPVVGDDVVIVTAGFPAKKTIAIKPGGSGDVTGTKQILWTYAKGTAYVVSPLLYDGLVYLPNDRGALTALDAQTGEVKYEGGRVPVPASFMGSPIAAEGKILMTSEEGDTFVIKAGPKHEVLTTNSVGEPVYTTPAISNGRIYVRGEKHLFAVKSQVPDPKSQPNPKTPSPN